MLDITLVPLLRIERDLYDMPRDVSRFRRYLEVIQGDTDDVQYPPLVALNPMGREHVAETLDTLLSLDAESVAAEAVEEACRRLAGVEIEGQFKLGLVVVDDLKGGWTNRQFVEMGFRFTPRASLKRGWIPGALWTTEVPTVEAVRLEVLQVVFRTVFILEHGEPRTLGAMMGQEGHAAAFSGVTGPAIDPEDLDYSRQVITPHLGADDLATQFACLYGDAAAKAVGFVPLGLSPRAGYSVAVADALAAGVRPEHAVGAG
jgi:hypothetical protein